MMHKALKIGEKSPLVRLETTLKFVFILVMSLIPAVAFADGTFTTGTLTAATPVAGNSNAIEQTFCNVILIMTGTTGKAVATVGIIGLGMGALFGKVSWNVAMLSVLGIGLVFGSAGVVGELGGGPGLSLILGSTPDASTTDTGFSADGTTAEATTAAGSTTAGSTTGFEDSTGTGTSATSATCTAKSLVSN